MKAQFYQMDPKSDVLISTDDSMDDRALAYADGFFSTLGVYRGRILWQDAHGLRLQNSAAALCLNLKVDQVMSGLAYLARQIDQGILKVIVSRPSQPLRGYGFLARDDDWAIVRIKAMPAAIYQDVSWQQGIPLQKSVSATTLPIRLGARTDVLRGLKLLACPEQVLAHAKFLQLANTLQVQDAIIQDINGNWQCATMGNIFYRLQGRWFTPPVVSGVAGVMQGVLCQRYGICRRALADNELSAIDAMIITNAVRGMTPVSFLYDGISCRPLGGYLPTD